MKLGSPNFRTRLGRGGAVALGVAAVASSSLLLAACSSASPSSAALDKGCQSVSAVLSDGPDPTADPVGYAEAQILPLGQEHTGDQTLQSAVERLDDAYRQLYSTDGGKAAATAVDKASNDLNALCPGAAP